MASASSVAPIAAPTMARSNRRAGRNMPGVSTNINWRRPTILTARRLVRVVCTLCETIETLRPMIWLISVLLPAFVGPMIATNPEYVSVMLQTIAQQK